MKIFWGHHNISLYLGSFLCILEYFRLNIFYCISNQRDWTQVITTLDSPFPNITTDYISCNGGYNNTYSIHIHSQIPPSSHTATPVLLKKYCKEGLWTVACQLFKPL